LCNLICLLLYKILSLHNFIKIIDKISNIYMEKKYNNRNRRKKADLNSHLLEAAQEMIKEVGFSDTTVVGIASKANIQASVFYNRFKDLDDFFEKLVREYDYWFNDSIIIEENLSAIQNYENGMNRLIDSFIENEIMQQLIKWELTSKNFITQRTAENRENNSKYLINYFSKDLKNETVDFNVLTSLIIGGIYYLILHRNLSTFTSVDFSTKKGIGLLKSTINSMVRKIYGHEDGIKNHEQLKIAKITRNLHDNGVGIEVIQKSYGLPIEVINSILDYNEEEDIVEETKNSLPTKRKRGRPKKVK
jgi:Transcriptional regulator